MADDNTTPDTTASENGAANAADTAALDDLGNEAVNFTGLVLGCIEAKFCK